MIVSKIEFTERTNDTSVISFVNINEENIKEGSTKEDSNSLVN